MGQIKPETWESLGFFFTDILTIVFGLSCIRKQMYHPMWQLWPKTGDSLGKLFN